jgi:hypothetical protein
VNINININNFNIDTNNAVPPPSVNNNPNNFPDQPPPPPPPPGPDNPNFRISGLLFDLFLTHTQVQTIAATGTIAAQIIPNPAISTAVLASIAIIQTVDAAGGNNGVDISGVIGTSAIMITPHGTVTIFDVVNVVNGVAQIVADQTNSTAAAAIQTVKNEVDQATNAVDNAEKNVKNFVTVQPPVVISSFGAGWPDR